jgi:hypothetical protein
MNTAVNPDKFTMTVGQLVEHLQHLNQDARVLVSNDEELNTLYEGFMVSKLTGTPQDTVVIYGLDGCEVDE